MSARAMKVTLSIINCINRYIIYQPLKADLYLRCFVPRRNVKGEWEDGSWNRSKWGVWNRGYLQVFILIFNSLSTFATFMYYFMTCKEKRLSEKVSFICTNMYLYPICILLLKWNCYSCVLKFKFLVQSHYFYFIHPTIFRNWI